MGLDIEYLLFLQNLRLLSSGIFDELLNAFSKFAVTVMPVLPYVIYWAVNKKWGYRYMFSLWIGEVVNGLIKLCVCAYRPWIRDARVEPAGDSKVAATGYSFPSGHTMVATINYGTTFTWQKNKRRWLAIICAVLLALTAFSRNFLGVHTPQDVIVGFLESALIIYLVGKIGKHFEGKERKLDYLTFIGIVLDVMVLIFIMLKPYPMEYVNGELLVNPQVMMNDEFSACGGFLGLMIGSYIERHYIHYEIPESSRNLPMMTVAGAFIIYSFIDLFAPATIILALGKHWGNLLTRLLVVLFATVVWPLCIRKIDSTDTEDKKKNK